MAWPEISAWRRATTTCLWPSHPIRCCRPCRRSRTPCIWRTASRAAPRPPSWRAAGASTWRRCLRGVPPEFWLCCEANGFSGHCSCSGHRRTLLWGRAALCAGGRRPISDVAVWCHRCSECHRARPLCAPEGGGPPARRPRREPAARRVGSKPGQAPPPPTGTVAGPSGA